MASTGQEPRPWKEFFEDAVLECDPRIFPTRLEEARRAIEGRFRELRSQGDASMCELVELSYAQHTISFLRSNQHG